MGDLKLSEKPEIEIQSLINTIRILNTDIEMEIDLDKSTTGTINWGKVINRNGIEIPNDQTIKKEHDETYNIWAFNSWIISSMGKLKMCIIKNACKDWKNC